MIYQLYVPAFSSSSIHALRAVENRLDYLNDGTEASLGVDAIYLSPFYPSSGYDGGYDVEDHRSIAEWAGTSRDFESLLRSAHERGIRVVIDFVANHTSVHHPWFRESARRARGLRSDWYWWHNGSGSEGPPNDWTSAFEPIGSAWSYWPPSRAYYLHSFLPQQPDLNWENRDVRQSMLAIMRTWLERGVDGFRIDAAHRLGKDPELECNGQLDFDACGYAFRHDEDWPTGAAHLQEMRRLADGYDAMLVGETYVLKSSRVYEYVATQTGLHLAHDFCLIRQPWDAPSFSAVIHNILALYGSHCTPSWLLGNHDHSRLVTRLGGPGTGHDRAKVAAMLMLTLPGTAFIYQGEELGLSDRRLGKEEQRDVLGRERFRSPMPWAIWESGASGTQHVLPDGVPDWLTMSEFHTLYRKLLWLRRCDATLRRGAWELVADLTTYGVLAFARTFANARRLIVLNFLDRRLLITIGGVHLLAVLISTDLSRRPGPVACGPFELNCNEGLVLEWKPEGIPMIAVINQS